MKNLNNIDCKSKKYVKPFSWVVVRKLGNREVVRECHIKRTQKYSVLKENLLHVLQGCQDLCSLHTFSQFMFLRLNLLCIVLCLLWFLFMLLVSEPRILQYLDITEVSGRILSATWNRDRTKNTTHIYLSDFPLNCIRNDRTDLEYNLMFVS